MKRIAIVLAILMMASTLACAAEAPKDKPKTEQTAVQKPEEPQAKAPAKEPTLQELQNQSVVLQLRISGAEAARNAVQQQIDAAKVELEILNRQIQAKTPKQEPKK